MIVKPLSLYALNLAITRVRRRNGFRTLIVMVPGPSFPVMR